MTNTLPPSSPLKKASIFLVSDGTGETASVIANALLSQFPDVDPYFSRYKKVSTETALEAILRQAEIHQVLIIYTFMSPSLRKYLSEQVQARGILAIDVLGGGISTLESFLGKSVLPRPGIMSQVDESYFKRVDAVESTLAYDEETDPKKLESIFEECDVILLGVSRTSKTPLSLYLAFKGYKVATYALKYLQELPLFFSKVDQTKFFALTIEAKALHKIRMGRTKSEQIQEKSYTDLEFIKKELEWAKNIFSENPRWPVFDMTHQSIEEIAAEILKFLLLRKHNKIKQEKRFF